jgi:hypothetical protein
MWYGRVSAQVPGSGRRGRFVDFEQDDTGGGSRRAAAIFGIRRYPNLVSDLGGANGASRGTFWALRYFRQAMPLALLLRRNEADDHVR